MKTIDRFLAGYLVMQSFAGAAAGITTQRAMGGMSLSLWSLYILAASALISGIGSFLNKRWARWLGAAVFAAQVFEIVTPDWMYRLFLAFRLALAFGWLQQVEIGINFLALAALIVASSRAIKLNKPHT